MLKGDRGDPGISLLNGTDDPDDIDDGLDGDFWLNTTTYELFGPKTAGSWPNGVSIMGIQGPAGTSILNDMIPPLVSVGNTGDFYIDTSTNTIYGPKPISGPWPAGVSIKGDQGDDGNTILYGTIDPPNSLGNDGDTYINTATMTIYFDKTAGAWPLTGVNIVGPRGQALLNGTVDPDDNNDGMNGDFYLNTITYDLFGPKTGGAWPPSVNIIGPPGNDGKTIRYGSIDPINSTGSLGDFYYNTSTNTFFGPKPSSGTWPEGVKLDGNTILNGSGTPSNGLGNDGDYYIDTVANTIAGPKNSGVWPTGRLLGSIFLTGTVDPTTEGVDGDYYFNSVTRILYGPKDTGVWPSNGTFLGTVLSSGTVNPTTEGVNGDYYINISTRNLFGPKTEGTWPTASAILGSIFLSGTNDPSSGTGQQGDYYINTTSRQLFGPKTNTTTWPAFSAILGNQILSGATTPPPSATGVQGDYYFCTSTGFMWGPKTSATVWPGTGTSLNSTNGTNGVTDYRYHFSYLGNTQITNRGLYIQGCVQDTATLSTPTNGMTSTTAYGYMLEKTSSLMEVHIRIRGACSNTSSPSTTADIRLNMRLHRWTATSTVTTAFFVDIPQSAFGYGAGSGVGRLQDYSPENTIGGISNIIYRYIAPSAILTLNVGEIFGLEFVSSATNTSIAGASNMNIQLVFRV